MERGYSEGKDTGEVKKTVKNKQEKKRKQVTISKRKQVIRETNRC